MAGKKISELQALTEITGQEMIPVARDGQNYSVLSSLLQSGDATKLNDYMYDVSELMGKMAVRGTQGVAKRVFDGDNSGAYNIDGTIGESSLSHATRYAKLNYVYYFDISYPPFFQPKPETALLLLFDKNDKILKAIPATEAPIKAYLCFTSEVYKYGVSYSTFPGSSCDFTNEYEIQDINDVLSSMNTEIEANTASISAVESNINTSQGNRALYVAAGAVYNEETGFYELNGLTDITETQMRNIYVQTNAGQRMHDRANLFEGSNIRTNLRFLNSFGIGLDGIAKSCFLNCFNLEVAAFGVNGSYYYYKEMNYCFEGCVKLKSVIGIIDIRNVTSLTRTFLKCNLLESIYLANLKVNVDFGYSPLLSLESLQYLITNAANTSAITVTVHADVYAKIQDETQADWHALIASAQ